LFRKNSSVKVFTESKDSVTIDQKVVIGMLAIDCWEYTKAAIESIRSKCRSVTFVYVDNGSEKSVVEQIKKYFSQNLKTINRDIDNIELIFNGENIGVAKGWNQVIQKALDINVDKILISNNDVVYSQHTVDGCVEAYDRIKMEDERTVMVTASNIGRDPNQLSSVKQKWSYSECPDFSCFMITPDTVKKIGMMDTYYIPAYFEDNHHHWKILLQGYKAYGCTWAPYCHISSRTRMSHPDLVTHEIFRTNRKKFASLMNANDVDQNIAVYRYEQWLAAHPLDPHPYWKDILNWCRENGKLYHPDSKKK